MKKKLVKNKDGLLSVNKKPSQQELKNLYKNLYYQKNLSKTYKKRYSHDEIKFNELNPSIAMDEAIEIAKVFGSDKSGAFINGVIDSFVQNDKI